MVESTKSRGRPRAHKKKGLLTRGVKRAASSLGIFALLGTSMLGMAGASAADTEDGPLEVTPMAATGWSDANGYYTGSGEGYYIGNFQGKGDLWLCAADAHSPRPSHWQVSGTANYSTPTATNSLDVSRKARGGGGANHDKRGIITGAKVHQAGYIASVYGSSGNRTTAAGASLGVIMATGMYNGSYYDNTNWNVTNPLPNAVRTRASNYLAEAQNLAGPYDASNPSIALDSGGGGEATIYPVKSAANNNMSGISYTATLEGPAEWASGGKTLTGTISGSTVTLDLVSTGSGNAHVTVTYSGLPAAAMVSKGTVGGVTGQDILQTGQKQNLRRAGDPVTVVTDFQPQVTTQVSSEFIAAGDGFSDAVTAAAAEGDEWIEDVDVLAEGTLYGPYDSPQDPSTDVPADAPVAGTDSVTFSKPGTKTAGEGVTAETSGYYTWVWSITKANQPEDSQRYITGDYTDGFFTASETTVVQFQPELATQVDSEVIGAGDSFTDEVTMSVTSDGGWMNLTDGTPAPVTAEGTLYGPFNNPQEPSDDVPADAPVAGTDSLTFEGPGSQTAGEDVTAESGGYYTWVWNITKANQADAVQPYITADYTDGFFTAGETSIVKFQPEVGTQVPSDFISAGEAFLDDVTASTAGDGVWPTSRDGGDLPVTAEGTLYGPFDTPQEPSDDVPADAPVAGTDSLTFEGPGTQQAGEDITTESNGYYTWVWEIVKDNQTDEAIELIEADYTDGFFTVGETTIARFSPQITTERDTDFVAPGDGLVDGVTVTLPDSQRWGQDADGDPIELVAKGTAYGPFTEPQEQQDDVPADAPVAGEEYIEFDSIGTKSTTGDTVATDAGFYTWVWEFSHADQEDGAADYIDEFSDDFFVELETSSARVTELDHYSKTREYNVVSGGRAFDTIEVGGFPEHHGDFDGLGDWVADLGTAQVTVYGPLADAPTTEDVTDGAPVFWQDDIDADNGRYRVGYDDENVISPTEQGFYVFVYSFKGDSKVAPFTSPFNDVLERFYVPGEETPEPDEGPSVITRAVPKAPVDTPFNDEAVVSGNVEEGSSLTFDLYGPFELDGNDECVAPGSIDEAGEPVFTSGPHDVDAAGTYASDEFSAEDAGCYFWVETLNDADGEQVHQGEIGAPGETTEVYTPDQEVTVTTKVQHDGEGDLPVVGDNLWDEIVVEGDVQDGDYTVVDLFTWETGAAPTCDEPVWTSEKVELTDGAGTYTTGKFVTAVPKEHGFVETTYNASGEVISRGECGTPGETITVNPGREVTVTTQAQHDGEGDLPIVGDNLWDDVIVEGDVEDGDYVSVDLYTWDEGNAPTCENPVWTSDDIQLDGEGTYTTDSFETVEVKVHGFVETTYNAEGEIISQGVCGEPGETVTVGAGDEGPGVPGDAGYVGAGDAGAGDAGDGAAAGDAGAGGVLQQTGAPGLLVGGIVAALMAAAGVAAAAGSRRRIEV